MVLEKLEIAEILRDSGIQLLRMPSGGVSLRDFRTAIEFHKVTKIHLCKFMGRGAD